MGGRKGVVTVMCLRVDVRALLRLEMNYQCVRSHKCPSQYGVQEYREGRCATPRTPDVANTDVRDTMAADHKSAAVQKARSRADANMRVPVVVLEKPSIVEALENVRA